MKISFCTTCKDRLYHLKQTLPCNIYNTSNLDREFVIVDYNSQDGLYDWSKRHLYSLEKQGLVRYVRTKLPKYFSAAHAKNIAHKNATGDVLCNLDCDNFITKGFCDFVLDTFKQGPAILASYSLDVFGNHGCCGKIAVSKDIFYSVNGYDEQDLVNFGWGWDDVNFRVRASVHNKIEPIYGDIRHNLVIGHSDAVRTKNFSNRNILNSAKISEQAIRVFVEKGSYVANVDKEWGYIQDLKIGLNS